jgi:hypothetical protein
VTASPSPGHPDRKPEATVPHHIHDVVARIFITALDIRPPRSSRHDRGQATTEYVLVLLGVAAIAIAVATWATSSGKVGELLDRVFDHVAGQVG